MSFETAAKTMEILNIDLFRAEVTNRPIAEEVDRKDIDNYYTVTINNTAVMENSLFGYCDISVVKRTKDEVFREVSASYLFHVQVAEKIPKGLVDDLFFMICKNNVWPYFVQLFSQIGTQASLQLPKLPHSPDYVEFDRGD